MLNPLPSLLIYGFFVPTLMRVVAAAAFIYIGQFLFRERVKLEALRGIPFVGRLYPWMVWLSTAASIGVAFFLFIGLGTQWAAIIASLVILKHLVGFRQYHTLLPFSRGAYILLLVICLSLLFSGAGALAFDLPL